MYKKFIAALCVVITCSFSANAALITVESADASLSGTDVDLAAHWATLSASDITSHSVDIASNLFRGSDNNYSIFKMTIKVATGFDINFSLFAGLDAGHGAEIFSSNGFFKNVSDDLWWNRSWSNGDVIAAENMSMTTGMNELTVFWAENTNSGGNSFMFSVDGGQRLVLSNENLATSVPTPSTIGLFALTLIGLSLSRRRKA